MFRHEQSLSVRDRWLAVAGSKIIGDAGSNQPGSKHFREVAMRSDPPAPPSGLHTQHRCWRGLRMTFVEGGAQIVMSAQILESYQKIAPPCNRSKCVRRAKFPWAAQACVHPTQREAPRHSGPARDSTMRARWSCPRASAATTRPNKPAPRPIKICCFRLRANAPPKPGSRKLELSELERGFVRDSLRERARIEQHAIGKGSSSRVIFVKFDRQLAG